MLTVDNCNIMFVCLFFLQMDVFDAAEKYQQAGHSLLILAGKEYGSGSSRDWAAKGPFLLVRLVVHLIINRHLTLTHLD